MVLVSNGRLREHELVSNHFTLDLRALADGTRDLDCILNIYHKVCDDGLLFLYDQRSYHHNGYDLDCTLITAMHSIDKVETPCLNFEPILG